MSATEQDRAIQLIDELWPLPQWGGSTPTRKIFIERIAAALAQAREEATLELLRSVKFVDESADEWTAGAEAMRSAAAQVASDLYSDPNWNGMVRNAASTIAGRIDTMPLPSRPTGAQEDLS